MELLLFIFLGLMSLYGGHAVGDGANKKDGYKMAKGVITLIIVWTAIYYIYFSN